MRMEKLVTAALVGTARQHGPLDTLTGAPVDALTAALPADEPERALLLRAGMAAIYRQAGQLAATQLDTRPPTPAPPETRPVCAPGIAMLLRQLLKDGNLLLPEAVDRLNRAGLRLPFDALPEALATQDNAVRLALAPTLGERGRWLSQFTPTWNWVEGALIEARGELPPDANTIWQEGNLKSRVALLRRARVSDPELARAWVAAVWKQEKAETRGELIGCYEVNLTAGDEPFLEAALDDRASGVRESAVNLLQRLPGSAFAARALERADAMLAYVNNKFAVTPPRDFTPEWARDGMTPKPEKSNEKGTGPRATWLTQAVSLVNPTHWQEQFALTPEQLIAAAETTDWSAALSQGWTNAALAHQATDWMLPLWRWRHQGKINRSRYGSWSSDVTSQLIAGAPANIRRSTARDYIARYPVNITDERISARQWFEAINSAPTPWDDEFSDAYLAGLRAFVPQITPELLDGTGVPWLQTLSGAQVALAPSRVDAALTPYQVPPPPKGKFDWQINSAQIQLDEFINTLRLRRRLLEEIPA